MYFRVTMEETTQFITNKNNLQINSHESKFTIFKNSFKNYSLSLLGN